MKDQARIRQLAMLAVAGLTVLIIAAVAFIPSGEAQGDPGQKFRGNFGVPIDELPPGDRAFYEMVMATEVAAITRIPTLDPLAPTEVWPTPPPRPTGIMGADGFLAGEFYRIDNMWQGKVGEHYVQVMGVTGNEDPLQGYLWVRTVRDDRLLLTPTQMPPDVWYKAPARLGPVQITEADGLALTLGVVRQPDRKFVFDVGKRTWQNGPGEPRVPALPATPPAAKPYDPGAPNLTAVPAGQPNATAAPTRPAKP